jgi:hypothetical protein
MSKQRVHNEFFQPVQKMAYGKGSRCPCSLSRRDRTKLGLDPSLYSWGQYSHNRWYCVDYFCQSCFSSRIVPKLIKHSQPCGCSFKLNARFGHSLPNFIKDAEAQCNPHCQVAA